MPTAGRFFQIVCLCLMAAILFGILRNQITARLCIEYFTVAQRPIIVGTDPAAVAFFWGIAATWWVGVPLGGGLAAACCFRPIQTTPEALVAPLLRLLAFMALCAVLGGLSGYLGHRIGWLQVSNEFADCIPPARHGYFLADALAHLAGSVAGFMGGLFLILLTVMGRFATDSHGVGHGG